MNNWQFLLVTAMIALPSILAFATLVTGGDIWYDKEVKEAWIMIVSVFAGSMVLAFGIRLAVIWSNQ